MKKAAPARRTVPRRPATTNRLRSRLETAAKIMIALLLLAYPVDWLVWEMRSSSGHGMGSVPVTDTVAATLKGNRFEIYSQQTTTVNCSHSLLPQGGARPCWWLLRHPDQITQY